MFKKASRRKFLHYSYEPINRRGKRSGSCCSGCRFRRILFCQRQSVQLHGLARYPIEGAVKIVFKNGGGVGGGSAGLAIQGEWVYDGCSGSIRSEEALENPYDSFISLSGGVFSWPFMSGWISDSHFSERDRLGRLITFQARIMEADQAALWLGLGMNDDSAMVVNSSGMATVYGSDSYIVKTTQPAETLKENSPLTIDAVEVYKLPPGSQFQIDNFEPANEPEIYSVEEGVLKIE